MPLNIEQKKEVVKELNIFAAVVFTTSPGVFRIVRGLTMDIKTRHLIQISLNLRLLKETNELVDNLMGKNPEYRFNFISKNAKSLDNSLIL